MRISDWSSDVCSSDLTAEEARRTQEELLDRAVGEVVGSAAGGDLSARIDTEKLDGMMGRLGERMKAQIGRASCRERVCQYVQISVVAAAFKQKSHNVESLTLTD